MSDPNDISDEHVLTDAQGHKTDFEFKSQKAAELIIAHLIESINNSPNLTQAQKELMRQHIAGLPRAAMEKLLNDHYSSTVKN